MDMVKDYIKEKYQKPVNVFLGMIHRLDRPVEGVVLFAKTSKGASRISEQKIYHAIVEGVPAKKEATLVNYLEKVGTETFKAKVTDVPGKNADRVELSYVVVDSNATNTLLKINLKTGKFHQIRAQLAHSGFPIVGDLKYGAKAPLEDGKIALYATSLTFKLPTKEEMVTVSIEVPKLS